MKNLFAVSAPRRGRDGNSHPSGRAKARSLNQGQPGGIPGVYRVGQSAALLLPEEGVNGVVQRGESTAEGVTAKAMMSRQWCSVCEPLSPESGTARVTERLHLQLQ